MPNDIPDKKPLHEADITAHIPDETPVPELPGEDQEHDLDDLVHNSVVDQPPTDEEIDADDVVHHTTFHSSITDDTERDPDDLVHGN